MKTPRDLARSTKLLPLAAWLFLSLLPFVLAQSAPPQQVRYSISLGNPGEHRLLVTMSIPPGAAEHDLQLPVWNALYQVRDFSQSMNWIRASHAGMALPLAMVNPSRWRLSNAEQGAEVEYEILAALPGPYGAEFNPQHAFFNLAEVLVYAGDLRSAPSLVHFQNVPSAWHAATALDGSLIDGFSAPDYDRLVDSPIELSSFHEEDFDEGGAHYRVVIDADPQDYDLKTLIPALHRIVAAETNWMNDRACGQVLFIYHFPHTSGGGGMEHAFSTAIELNARDIKDHPITLYSVTAHEFFHLWNVKRIRPQSLEPVDFTKENYTPTLWFSEGFTSTVGGYTLLRADLIDERGYLNQLAQTIAELESRPAHLTQSAEQSSLDAWLEKYPAYWRPERSISYYVKGELLGVLLDLSIREASHGTKSLRELFQSLNQNYAQRGVWFADSDGVRETAEALAHASFRDFFRKYVSGTDEIPWDEFFLRVGLHLERQSVTVADPSFTASRSLDDPPTVTSLSAGGEAERAGLAVGDTILELDGQKPGYRLREQINALRAGDPIRLKVRGANGERSVQWNVGSRQELEYRLQDVDPLSEEQKAHRMAWLRGETEPAAHVHSSTTSGANP
jgi:predicted metalloprotease with PDZ domain